MAAEHYRNLESKADDGVQCGHCETRCPFHVKQDEGNPAFAYFYNFPCRKIARGNMGERDNGDVSEDDILANAISVRIGREGVADWNVDMYNNDAALTMLDYLSGSALLFPTYTYDEEGGVVAQSVRGSYTRVD